MVLRLVCSSFHKESTICKNGPVWARTSCLQVCTLTTQPCPSNCTLALPVVNRLVFILQPKFLFVFFYLSQFYENKFNGNPWQPSRQKSKTFPCPPEDWSSKSRKTKIVNCNMYLYIFFFQIMIHKCNKWFSCKMTLLKICNIKQNF